jgi:predicted transcriptional regulator
MNVTALLIAIVVTVTALWRIEAIDGDRNLAQQTATHQAEVLELSQARVDEQAGVIEAQRAQLAKIGEADKLFRSIVQTIARDGAATRKTLQELKENDQAIAEYLRGAVPVAYGVQFERPETTDPTAYNPGSALPAGGLPPAGTPADPGK